MHAQRLIWTWYLTTVLVVVGCVAVVDGRLASPAHLALHLALLVLVRALPCSGRWARPAWVGFVVVGLPATFSAVGMVLPAINPVPCEWTCIAGDRVLLGADPTVVLGRGLVPWLVEILQLCYASFYFLPIVLAIALARARQWVAFDDVVDVVTFGFLFSYLGYLVFPTLPPYRFLEHDAPLQGMGLAEQVHALLHAMEANRFDCMPSGHTMLTLVTLGLAWRYARRTFVVLLPIGSGLVLATVALRYHYAVDVLAGAALAPVSVVLARRARAGLGALAGAGDQGSA